MLYEYQIGTLVEEGCWLISFRTLWELFVVDLGHNFSNAMVAICGGSLLDVGLMEQMSIALLQAFFI
jgi:hypothetical protein